MIDIINFLALLALNLYKSIKNVIKFSFFFVVFFICLSSSVYAAVFDKIVLRVNYSDSSCPKDSPPTTTTPIALGILDTGCSDAPATLVAFSNCVAVYSLACNVAIYDDVAYSLQTVTGVPFGQETTAAQTTFENFVSSVQSKTCGDGYVADGYLAGYVYETKTDVTTGSVNVDVSMWKRTVCSTLGNGTLTPIGSLSGGSSGGTSIDYAQMQTAVQGALDNSTALADIATGTDGISSGVSGLGTQLTGLDSLLTSIDSKIGSGTGLTQAETQAAVAGGVGDALGTSPGGIALTPGTPPSIPTVYEKKSAYLISEIDDLMSLDFTARFNQFITDMKATPLFSKVLSLSDLADVSGGASVLQVSFGSFGDVNFDLANYAGTYNYIKGFLLLLGSYLMIRIIVLKR